jgi:Co/Zn/Cd efflux system component
MCSTVALSETQPKKDAGTAVALEGHSHVFLGTGHEQNERKTWTVIVSCSAMMLVEIVGGSVYGSLALVADGLHMSTHASAILIAALALTKHGGMPMIAASYSEPESLAIWPASAAPSCSR